MKRNKNVKVGTGKIVSVRFVSPSLGGVTQWAEALGLSHMDLEEFDPPPAFSGVAAGVRQCQASEGRPRSLLSRYLSRKSRKKLTPRRNGN